MKKYVLTIVGVFMGLLSMAQVSVPPGGGSQRSVVRQYLGAVPFIEIAYNSPSVTGPNEQSRKGQIWGGLVPYDLQNLGFGLSTAENPSPWRAGADQNTTIEFSHDVTVQGKALKAGKYGFHIIPKETGEWTLIFSNDNNHWGSFFYRAENDALRVTTTPTDSPFAEDLTYEFVNRNVDKVTVQLRWEEKAIPFEVAVPNSAQIHLAQIESELNNQTGFNYLNQVAGANYALSIGNHEAALMFVDKAINEPFFGQKDFTTLSTKAQVLMAMKRNDEAFKIMDEAVRLPGATVFAIHGYGRQLIAADKKKEALEIFKYNAKTNAGQWPVNYGLARGYSAVGDYKNAIKYMELALKNVPAGDTQNPPIMKANLEKLKKGEDIN
jgi:tetratricopeptide (TPR) repeat protein